MRTFARRLVTVLLLCMIVGCQSIGTSDQFSHVKEDEIFLISDGVLTSYLGSDSEIRIPEDVVAIGPDAFTTSMATNNVSKISLGRNVEIIDPAAFRGLPNLKSVDIYTENPFFVSGKDEFGTGGFIYGTREPIVFYFPDEDDAVHLSRDDGTPPYFYGENKEMLFVCHGAVFSLRCKTIGKQIHWYCDSIQHRNNSVDFQSPVEFEGGNYQTYLFETSDLELVFETVSYNFSDAWMLTENMVMELHPERTPDYSISLHRGDDGTLRYRKIKAEYSTQEQADEISQRITARDNYYGEDGKAYVSNGEWKFVVEKIYTVSDYFRMKGTNIDDWFLSLNSPYSTLEQLMESNRRCEG